MAKKGLRSTDQRNLIIETFFGSPAHISIDELLEAVRKRDPRIGYATVYRTLKLLVECNVAYERHFSDGVSRYEMVNDDAHHDHMICVSCGVIAEFEDREIERLQEQVALRHGFQLRFHKHELYGLCGACVAKGGTMPLDAPRG